MATTYTVSVNVKCWKTHKCIDCGCEYRYRFERKVQGQGNSERAAYDKAHKNVAQAVGDEVDVRPCPTCGRVQPDMVGQVKAKQHAWIGVGTIPLVAIVIVLGLTYVLAGNLPSMIVAAVLGGAALLNFIIAAGNPNRDLAKNVSVSDHWINSGALEVTEPGDATQAEKPPGVLTFAHWLGLGLAALAVVVALAPTIYQTLNNLPLNADTKPDVVSPGDEVKVYFPERIDTIKSYWRSVWRLDLLKGMNVKFDADGRPMLTPEQEQRINALSENLPYSPPKALIVNADELGLANVVVTASASDSTWQNNMSVKSREKHTHPSIWAKLKMPDDDKLADKTVKVLVMLDLMYPQADGDKFFTHIDPVNKTFELKLAKKGAGQRYSTIWLGGLILGSLMSVTASFYLRSLNKQLRLHAIKPIVEQIQDDDSPAAPADADEPKDAAD